MSGMSVFPALSVSADLSGLIAPIAAIRELLDRITASQVVDIVKKWKEAVIGLDHIKAKEALGNELISRIDR